MPELDFARYEKMPKTLKKLGLSVNDFMALEKLDWVVTEKAHGANFSFIYENKQLKFAKRKALLTWKDDFFGFQTVVKKNERQITSLFEALSRTITAKRYIIYGELIGGAYPHPHVEVAENVQAIQTGVYYTPNIEFYAFDIAIIENEVEDKYYLDYTTTIDYFEEHQLLYAKPLMIGKYNEVFEFDTKIKSTIPHKFQLPELTNNLIEGVVIKPLKHNTIDLPFRPIFKIKNAAFEEERKFHLAEKWSFKQAISAHSEDVGFLVAAARNYVTENRLNSAVSKIGALTPDRLVAIKNEFLEDILMDFNEDNEQILEDINPAQRQWIKDRLIADITQLIDNLN